MDNIKKEIEAIRFCIKTNELSKIPLKDMIIWSSGSSKNPVITLETLKMAEEALLFYEDFRSSIQKVFSEIKRARKES